MEVYLKSDIGLVRTSNQDACKCGSFSDQAVWAVVCDGMGGANGGNVASEVAVETVAQLLMQEYDKALTNDQTVDLLTGVVQRANSKLYEMQKADQMLRGMGTTIELVLVKENKVHIVHVGDSRVYAIRKNKIQQLTVDHSVVQEMVEKGELTPEQAMVHPNKNYITRALGIVPQIHLDYIEAPFEPGDKILLCSDGLTNYLTPEEIVKLSLENNADAFTQALVDGAKELGGSDNITVAVITAQQ
ncbi:MAG: Stp1/IreP family PP2C-type Ser/Thr phosphatase [Acutalibacteraceae bacterium]|nr:Stp1/IreP family PP2C-type Ser/Thr phosphatase [Acutalibacteraceae bacterium]HIR02933.1 Stp1/IreP family PP2C-type Ser/Thr phosphatase [Candidatus Scatovicinus merdipullorum]